MTTPTDDDTAALVAEACEYAAKQTEFAALWLPEHPKTAREAQYPADLLTRLAAALEAATARANTLDLQLVEAMNIAAGGLYAGPDGETWSDRVNDLEKENRRLREALEAATAREGREARLREALMDVDANTPTQGFVQTVSKRPVAFDHVSFLDLQKALASIGDIARAALGDTGHD